MSNSLCAAPHHGAGMKNKAKIYGTEELFNYETNVRVEQMKMRWRKRKKKSRNVYTQHLARPPIPLASQYSQCTLWLTQPGTILADCCYSFSAIIQWIFVRCLLRAARRKIVSFSVVAVVAVRHDPCAYSFCQLKCVKVETKSATNTDYTFVANTKTKIKI